MNPNAQPNTMPSKTQRPPQDADSTYNVNNKTRKVKQPGAIPTAYLPQNEYAWTYYEAQKQARLFFLPFNEYERLAANKIREDLGPNMPRVNDGSLAGLLMETPMRILAQPFTGHAKVLESIDPKTKQPAMPQPWLGELINVLWEREIIPYANTQAPFFQKQQLALYRALIYGSCPIYTFFTNRNGRRSADMVIPYIRDVYLEVGKSSDLDSDYIFFDQYYTRLQLDKILAAGNRVEATGVKSPWNLKALKQIRDSHVESQKDYLSKNPAERNRPVRSTQIKFTTVFQRGVGAPFDTFYNEGNKEDLTIVKSKINEDPTGDLPIHFLYAYEDLINPYGKGQIEISGGTQNVLDYMTQLHVLANQVGLQPPIVIEGDRSSVDLDSMVYAPTQFWFTGGAKIDIMETSSSILKEFPTAYAMYKGQLIGMQGTSTTDVTSESGDPTKGKTPTALDQQAERQNSHDNFLMSQAVQTFSRVFKSMLNIKFANMQGSDIIKLEADDAAKLMRAGLIPADPKNPNVPQSQQLDLDWNTLRGKFDFEVDPESSVVKNNADQVAKLMEIPQLIAENPYLVEYIQQTGNQLNLGEVYEQIFTKLGLQDIEKILTPIPQEQMGNQPPPMAFDKPSIDLKYTDMPPAAQVQLLGHVGLNVNMMDVLMGPVLDANIRGVFQPEPNPDPRNPQQPQPPTNPGDVQLPKGATLVPNDGGQAQPMPQPGQPMPGQPPQAPMPGAAPQPAPAPQGPPQQAPQSPLKPETSQLIQQTMAEKGVSPQVAAGIIHARAYNIPENEIQTWLDKHKGQNGPTQ